MAIGHISDTARWVAAYRAMESGRPDAIFHDPFAARLAGVEGTRIVDTIPRGRQMAWAMIVRTALFDDFVRQAIGEGCDAVVNLAAGLDARPWRLDLPAALRWFDVDLPGILDHKLGLLGGETPRCAYEAIRTDLTDPVARRETFERIGRAGSRVLVLTEGLLIYLTSDQVADLARALHEVPTFHTWVIDLASPRLLAWSTRTWGKALDQGNAPFRFAPAAGTGFFAPLGWHEVAYRSVGEEAYRLKRTMRGAWIWRAIGRLMSATRRAEMNRMSGVVRLDRT